MRVLLAGATGALGRRLIPRLRAAGHEVVGASRSTASAPALEAVGAAHVAADLLDPGGLTTAIAGVQPDVVVHAAKAIPKRGPLTYRDMRGTNRLHDEGTANLLAAAIAAGARRFVAESIVFLYGYGDLGPTALTEHSPPRLPLPSPRLAAVHDGVVAMERHCAAAQDRIETVVLRTGLFYGPHAGTEVMATMLAKHAMPLPAGGPGRWPLIYIEDLADAMLLGLTGPVGTYNVVDDESVPLRTFVQEVARVADAPGPWSLPKTLARLVAPYFAEVATTSMTVSNAKAKAELGWTPAHPTYREGLAAWAATSKSQTA